MEEVSKRNADTYTPHRRPDRHRRIDIGFVLRLVLEGFTIMLALWAVLAAAEGLCVLAGCPADAWAVR